MLMNFHFLVPTSLHSNSAENGPLATKNSKFNISYVNDIGPRSRNDLDLQYSHIFINLISCRSQAATVSEKSTFSYRRAKVTKFDLAVK